MNSIDRINKIENMMKYIMNEIKELRNPSKYDASDKLDGRLDDDDDVKGWQSLENIVVNQK